MREKIVNSIILLVILTLSFLIGSTVTYNFMSKDEKIVASYETEVTGVVKCANDIKIDETGISASVGKIYDATVTIQNYRSSKLYATGSGFVYKKDDKYGYILTNHHVIEGANQIIITLSNDKQIEGKLLGSDKYLDLAVLQINASEVKQVATLGKSSESNVGDTVFTVGTPVGYNYRGTVTKGTLSGKNRIVTVSINATNDMAMNVLQIDAALNPGNSGGPLLNVNGEVIGINSMKLSVDEIEGMGFAIPIEEALKYIDKLETGEEIIRPLIGINMANVTDIYVLYQNRIEIDSSLESGVVVMNVVTGSGAEQGGLQKGDVITKLNGKQVKTVAYLKYELFKFNVNDTIELTINRNGEVKTLKVTLTQASNY